MGIDVYVFDFLLNFAGSDLGDALCLGRQGMNLGRGDGQWDVAQQVLTRKDPERRLEDLLGADGYAETFLAYLGCRTTQSMDYSPFEGAEIVCDLNKPVPRGLWDRFDLILDGGTLEHVFDIPTAIHNVKHMLRPSGIFISINAANNQMGHGLYQFSPELFWRVFAPETGFVVEKMQLMPLALPPTSVPLTDPAGHRQEIGPTQGATYLMVAARRRDAGPVRDTVVYQSDYAAAWKGRAT